MPTQLYAAIDAGLLALVLWFYYPFRRRDGEVFALLITLHPISRFFLEMIRSDEPGQFGTGLTISQWLSLGDPRRRLRAMVVCGDKCQATDELKDQSQASTDQPDFGHWSFDLLPFFDLRFSCRSSSPPSAPTTSAWRTRSFTT